MRRRNGRGKLTSLARWVRGSEFLKVFNGVTRTRSNSSSHIDDPSRKNSNKLKRRTFFFPDPVAEVPFLLPLTSKLTGINLQQQPLQDVDRPQGPDHHQYRVIGHSGQNRSVCGRTGTAAQFCCWCRSCHRRHRGQDSPPMTSQDVNSLSPKLTKGGKTT